MFTEMSNTLDLSQKWRHTRVKSDNLAWHVPYMMLSFEQYSLSFKNTRSKLTNLDIKTYIKRESKENSRKFKKKLDRSERTSSFTEMSNTLRLSHKWKHARVKSQNVAWYVP